MSMLTLDRRTAPTASIRGPQVEQPVAAKAPTQPRPRFLVALLRALSCLAA